MAHWANMSIYMYTQVCVCMCIYVSLCMLFLNFRCDFKKLKSSKGTNEGTLMNIKFIECQIVLFPKC